MSEQGRTEKSKLVELFLLLKGPQVFSFFAFMFISTTSVSPQPNMWWILAPMTLIAAYIFYLPVIWQGRFSYSEVAKRVFRPADRWSIALAIFPIILWFVALIWSARSADRSYGIHFPSWLFESSPFRAQMIVSVLFVGLSGLLGILLIANASDYSSRVKFLCLLFGFNVAFRCLQYGWNYYTIKGIPAEMASQMISPVFDIALSIGKFVVLLALFQRGRSSVQAVAVFLVSFYIFQLVGLYVSAPAALIGLLGGAGLIFLINYLQQSGRWPNYSAENQT